MERHDAERTEPRPGAREPREREVAPPIEREHETQEGIVEEDERRAGEGGRREREGEGERR
ncbi:MAG TPA: hypothetical protein VF841_21080 [Anaeromyxobacter sp.]